MTDGVGGKTVYQPINIENNAQPTPVRRSSAPSPGLLEPSPNTTWVTGVVKHDAESEAKRDAFVAANGAMGDRNQYLVNQLDAALAQKLPQLQQGQQEESSAGLSTINNTVEDARDSSQKSLDLQAKHDEAVAEKNKETLNKLHNERLQQNDHLAEG
jgi:hypothetical protein